jgi:hypothetical protein
MDSLPELPTIPPFDIDMRPHTYRRVRGLGDVDEEEVVGHLIPYIRGTPEELMRYCDGIIAPNDADLLLKDTNPRQGTIPMAIYHVIHIISYHFYDPFYDPML